MLKSLSVAAAIFLALTAPAFAQGRVLSRVPSDTATVADWYRQTVYDSNDKKVGTISDVLLDKDGKVAALIVAVGGFVGVGSKDVAVPFSAVQSTTKNNRTYLVMNTTKEELTSAPGYKFDRTSRKWVPADTTNSPAAKKR
jgi:sporulation protein YlmC with PRC-barrel domain